MYKVARQGGLVTAVAAVLVMSAHASSPDPAYRLAGTLDAGPRGWLAVLEMPNGEQQLLKKGDSINGAQVIDIGDEQVKLRRDGEVLILSLEGGESDLSYGDLPPEFFNLEASDALRATLDELGRTAKSDEQLATRIRDLLQIPGDGRIATIDDQPVTSVKHGVKLLKQSMIADHPVRVAVTGVEGFDAVYVMPQAPPIEDD